MAMRLSCILLVLLLAGCSAAAHRVGKAIGEAIAAPFVEEATTPPDAPAFQPVAGAPPDRAVLYVYRPPGRSGSYPEVWVGGQKFALKAEGYRAFALGPGEHEIKVDCSWNWYPPTAMRTLSVEAGQEYFVRITATMAPDAKQALDPRAKPAAPSPLGACRTGRTLIMLIPRDEALAEIRRTRLLTE